MTGARDEPGELDPRTEAARQKRRARVFGDVLPESTSDDRGDTWGDQDQGADDWLRRQVPPHHG